MSKGETKSTVAVVDKTGFLSSYETNVILWIALFIWLTQQLKSLILSDTLVK